MGFFDRFKRKQEKNDIEEIIAKIDCECLIVEVNSVEDVMEKYQRSLNEGKQKGYTPLIIIPSETLLETLELAEEDRESIIEKANDIDVKQLLRRLLEDAMPEEDEDDIAGDFLVEEPSNAFLSLEEAIREKIIIAKIPTVKPWEVAAWVPMGGFNECPMPEEQMAVFKYWYEKYAAIPAVVTADVWEFFVQHAPQTQEESQTLAWEQFGFCGDIVWQGVGSVNSLAGTLMNSSVWYFWWD